jgi:hypothetical protein
MFSCTNNHSFTIEGKLPSKKYDGQWMYLVPMTGANQKTIDSVKVKDGTFEFKGDSEKIYILRMKPILRLELQELLVITEKGIIKARIDKNSTSGGTPQNEALQQWKDQQMKTIKLYQLAHHAIVTAKCNKQDSLKWINKLDSMKAEGMRYNINLLKRQKNNTLGQFLYNQISFIMSPKDKTELEPIFKKKK